MRCALRYRRNRSFARRPVVEQALGNLPDNASKYAARGGHIWLSAQRTEAPEGGGEAIVRVRDDERPCYSPSCSSWVK